MKELEFWSMAVQLAPLLLIAVILEVRFFLVLTEARIFRLWRQIAFVAVMNMIITLVIGEFQAINYLTTGHTFLGAQGVMLYGLHSSLLFIPSQTILIYLLKTYPSWVTNVTAWVIRSVNTIIIWAWQHNFIRGKRLILHQLTELDLMLLDRKAWINLELSKERHPSRSEINLGNHGSLLKESKKLNIVEKRILVLYKVIESGEKAFKKLSPRSVELLKSILLESISEIKVPN